MKQKLDPDEYVYCLDCKFYHENWTLETTPAHCLHDCYPFNPEDSQRFSLRKKYQKIEIKENNMKNLYLVKLSCGIYGITKNYILAESVEEALRKSLDGMKSYINLSFNPSIMEIETVASENLGGILPLLFV